MTRFANTFARRFAVAPGHLIQDFAGGAALVVMLLAILHLPGLV
ncbi:MAG: hypothetical protein QNJ13_10025 [Paracoccaceae bacterium]|nr:hypothetical protein [Paracoccaceae bacterium]